MTGITGTGSSLHAPQASSPPRSGGRGPMSHDDAARRLVLVRRLVVGLLLVARSLLLVLGFPLVVRHAVDDLAGLRVGDLDTARAGFLAVPARQAIAAETGQVHQVDVLHIRA